jgi:hypothetical protein
MRMQPLRSLGLAADEYAQSVEESVHPLWGILQAYRVR